MFSITTRKPVGPRLAGALFRRPASDPNFRYYSVSLRTAKFTWTRETLREFLVRPEALIGQRRHFPGPPLAPMDTEDLLEYLVRIMQ